MATWPTSLPQVALARGYAEQGLGNTIRTEMDAGPPKRRRRYTKELIRYPFVLVLTETQLDILETFYVTTLTGGVDAFDWIDQRDGTTVEYAFYDRPQYAPIGGGRWEARFTLEALV